MRHITDTIELTAVPGAVIGQQTYGDMAGAVAAQLAELQLQAALTGRRGHVSPCRIVYQTKTMAELKIARCVPLDTDYAGIWAFLVTRMGRVLERDGITSMAALLSPNSPIKVGFAREMPCAGGYPDEIISDGNSDELMKQAHTSLLVDAISNGEVAEEHTITFK